MSRGAEESARLQRQSKAALAGPSARRQDRSRLDGSEDEHEPLLRDSRRRSCSSEREVQARRGHRADHRA